jgi:hypothetical protein
MKRSIWILVALLVVLVSLAFAGLAFAQSGTPDAPGTGFRSGGFGGGRWNGAEGYGPMHEYMVVAFAEALGISAEDLQAAIDSGKTMWDVAQDQGKTEAEFAELMISARTSALNQAVEDGVITREQADWMIARMAQMQANGYGPGSNMGNCPMHGGSGSPRQGMSQGGRWNR